MKVSMKKRNLILLMFHAGYNVRQICEKVHSSPTTIRSILIENKFDFKKAKKIKAQKQKEEYKKMFWKLLKTNNRIPPQVDIRAQVHVSYNKVISLYRDLVKSAKRLGYVKIREDAIGKKELIQSLIRLSKRIGRTPGANDMNKRGIASSTVYIKRFGSVRNAQIAAGLIPNKGGRYHFK